MSKKQLKSDVSSITYKVFVNGATGKTRLDLRSGRQQFRETRFHTVKMIENEQRIPNIVLQHTMKENSKHVKMKCI